MARFYGKIGYASTEEVKPGVHKEIYTERSYKGDVLTKRYNWQNSDYLNDDLVINNDISIISDNFATNNFGAMRYVRWMDQLFKITSATVDLDRHRITLSLGGIFNADDTN